MTEQERHAETPNEGTPAEQIGATPEASAGADEGEAKAAPAASRPPRASAAPAGPSTAVVLPQRVPGQPIVSRRRLLQFGFWSSIGAMMAGLGACGLDLIYPSTVTGFGGKVSVDPGEVPHPGEKKQIPRGRFWLVNLSEAQGGPGLLALWWKCPHLGCTVPWRPTFIWPDPTTGAPKQGWFRCPCHGSTYTDAGVRVYGPAPRSMDTMALTVSGGHITVDTGKVTKGTTDNPNRAVRI